MFDISETPATGTDRAGCPTARAAACLPPASARTHEDDPRYAALAPLWTGLTLPQAPRAAAFEAGLRAEAPGLDGLAAWLAGEIRLRRALSDNVFGLPPILLYGPPGVGKTHLARRIADLAAVPSHLLPLAASSDARTLLGTSAGYASGAACMAAQVMAQTRCAAPVLILDEIDKAGRDARNGCWSDGLLPFLEPVSARDLFDEFLMTGIDCSRISWIATANDISGLPRPLLSRFACFEIPACASGSRAQMLSAAARAAARDLGLDASQAACLFDHVLQAGLGLPEGASLRGAKGLLRAALAEQLGSATRH